MASFNKPFAQKPRVSVFFTDTGLSKVCVFHYVTDTTNMHLLFPQYVFVGTDRRTATLREYVYTELATLVGAAAVKGYSGSIIVQAHKKRLLQVHGNILYDVTYNSALDTPYAARDIYHHMVQTYLDVTCNNDYPFRLYLSSNFSNSGLFKNFTNLNLQFNSKQFYNVVLGRLKDWAAKKLDSSELNKMQADLDVRSKELKKLTSWLNSGDVLQKLVEAREAEYIKKNQVKLDSTHRTDSSGVSSVNNTGGAKNFQASYDAKRKQFDSLNREFTRKTKLYEQKKARLVSLADSLRQELASVRDKASLLEKISTSHIPDSLLPKGYSRLLAIKSFGIGSTPVNYSSLTIQNINVTGVQVEYNPSFYAALTSGTVSYRFRDYLLNTAGQPKQYVTAVRFGVGRPEGNSIIFTYYTGKKYLYNYNTTVNGSQVSPNINIMGISLFARRQLDKNTYVTAEAAKSSLPYYAIATPPPHIAASTFRFNDRSNEAYIITFSSLYPKTHTTITGSYRYTGSNFQSFSFFTTSSAQTSWYIKLHQPFFNKKVLIDAAVRKNDFSNPYVNQTYNSSIIFKSIQATLRLKKLPVLTMGYYPTSQLVKMSDNYFREDLFNTLVGTATYAYRCKATVMNTMLMYMQFYNKERDSSFIYANTKNLQVNHSLYFKRVMLQAIMSVASNSYYNLYAVGGSVQYSLNSWLKLGGGVQYNRQNIMLHGQLGYSANMQIKVKNIGQVEARYTRGYVPGANKNLVLNDVGRLTYYKIF